MKSKTRKVTNARREYRQQFLSGFEPVVQPGDANSNSKTLRDLTNETPQVHKGARCYNLSIPLIIEQVSNDSGEYIYRVLLNDDANILVAPYSIRGKKETGQAVNLPKTGIKGGTSFSMVYGVHEDGVGSLSHTKQHPIQQVAPQLYGYVLGAIDRAIQCTILITEDQKGDDGTGQRIESTPTSEVLGTDKKARRGKKVLSQVLPETLPEEAANLVEDDRKILGGRQEDAQNGLDRVRGDAYHGEGLEDLLTGDRPPDIGF